MSVKFAAVQGAAPTSAGTQTFTKAGFGTPVAAIFYCTNGVVNGTNIDHAFIGAGFTDGISADDRNTSVGSTDASASSNTHRQMGRGHCISILNTSNPATIDGEADWDAWITDGVRIDWTNAPGTAVLVNCILIGGSDVVANVIEKNLGSTVGVETSIAHGLGETPVMAFFLGTNGSPTGVSTNWMMNFGCMTFQSSTITQRVHISFAADAQTTMQLTGYLPTTRCFGSLSSASPSRSWECTTVDGTNIGLTHRGPNAFGGDVQTLAIGFGAAANEVELASFDSRTTTGTTAITTANSWKPQFILLNESPLEAENSFANDSTAEGTSLGIIDADNEYCVAASGTDAAADSDCKSVTSNKAMRFINGAGTVMQEASILTGSGSINSDGFTIDVTTENLTTATKCWWLAVEEDAAGGITANIGLLTEADLTQSLGKAKARAIGLNIETDLAQPLVQMQFINIGLVSESEVSQAFSALKQRAIGLLTEANLAQVFSKSKSKQIGLTSESDLSQVFSKAKSKAIGLVSEIELAQTFSTAKALVIGIVAETELAQAIGSAKAKVIGLLSETDQVFAFDTFGLTVNMGLVLETDIVQTLGKTKDKAIGLLTEADLASAVSSAKSTPLGLITEFDIPFALGTAKLRSIGLIAELDAPLAFAVERGVDIGLLLETDTVFAMSAARALSLGLVSESDIVFSMSSPSIILVTNLVQREARFQVKLRRDGLFTETLKRESKFAQSVKRDAKF